ncbi:DMT family transporter [Neobacillus terrae]|uniref:DMT family transporter n=1 Tax=Neobacillus terrae TaxID=3034837 RepID=UPI00140AF5CD|nr:DMT family transporter [Neobacillus terrae]NHM33061.1 DMT family transporter [Neobacillus terrae]
MQSRNNKALVSLLFVSILWGCNYPVSAYLLKGFSPVILSTVRICFTSLFLIVTALFQKGMRRPTASEWKFLLGVGIFGTLFNQTFYFTGLHHTTPANASLILALAPIATILLERVVFKIRLTAKKSIGALISLVGVFSIISLGSGGSFGISLGDFNVLLAMLSLSVSLLFIRGLSKSMPSYTVTVYATVLGSVLMIPAAGVEWMVSGTIVSHHPYMWVMLICAGILAQGIAGFWWNKGVAEVGAGTASMFMNLQPFVAIIASHFVLGNAIMPAQIGGGVLVLLGVYIANLPAKPALAVEPNKSA